MGERMRQIRHALSGAIYELTDDGGILVTKDSSAGRFTTDGRWLGGDLRVADPELCRWIGSGAYRGVTLAASRRYDGAADAGDGGRDS
jgi:hypothetical protein